MWSLGHLCLILAWLVFVLILNIMAAIIIILLNFPNVVRLNWGQVMITINGKVKMFKLFVDSVIFCVQFSHAGARISEKNIPFTDVYISNNINTRNLFKWFITSITIRWGINRSTNRPKAIRIATITVTPKGLHTKFTNITILRQRCPKSIAYRSWNSLFDSFSSSVVPITFRHQQSIICIVLSARSRYSFECHQSTDHLRHSRPSFGD